MLYCAWSLLFLTVLAWPALSVYDSASAAGNAAPAQQLSPAPGLPSASAGTARILTLSPEGVQRQRARFTLDMSREAPSELATRVHAYEDSLTKITSLSRLIKECRTAYDVFMRAVDDCAQKNYSTYDQQAARCLPTDTISQCEEKMLRACVAGASARVYDTCRNSLSLASLVRSEIEGVEALMPRLDKLCVQGPQTFGY